MSRWLHGGNASALPAFLAAAAVVALVAEMPPGELALPAAALAFFSFLAYILQRRDGTLQGRLGRAWGELNGDLFMAAFASLLLAGGMVLPELAPARWGGSVGAVVTVGGVLMAAGLRGESGGRETLNRLFFLSILLLVLFSYFNRQLFLRLLEPVALGVTALSGVMIVLGGLRRLRPAIMVFMALWTAVLAAAAWRSWSVPLELPVRTQADEKLLREAFGDVVMMTLLPGRDRVRVFYKGNGNSGAESAAAAIIRELPYVEELSADIPGAVKAPSVGEFDVVIVRSGMPEHLTGCELMFQAYARMAANGALVVRRGIFEALPAKSRAALAGFGFRYPLEYPNDYEVFSNSPPQVSLKTLDERLAKLAPGNPLVPADVLGYLMEQANSLRPPVEKRWPSPGGPDLTGLWGWSWWWLLIPAVMGWWGFRLFCGGRGVVSFVGLDAVEDGAYAGAVLAVLYGFAYQSGMIDPILLGGGAVLIPLLLLASGGAVENWRRPAAFLLLLLSVWWLPNGMIWLVAALVVWRWLRRWIIPAAALYLPLLALWPQAAFVGALAVLASGILIRQTESPEMRREDAGLYNFCVTSAAALTVLAVYSNMTAIMPFAVALAMWRLPAVWRKK
ncbi:MAG: hypothetical protein PHI85_03665 [Victivallaceae bacterium]|nr:hypothetical protein [Victivallaceae bacterium]